MAEFKPMNQGLLTASVESAEKAPEVVLPNVGDTMKIAVASWGGYQVVDEYFSPSKGMKVIEVEVKGFKEAKVTYE